MGTEMRGSQSWQEAKDRTLLLWMKIRGDLGRAHPTDLLTDINLICPLCEKASEERSEQLVGETDLCSFCIAYLQVGGCREVCNEISARVAERDWDAARDLADRFIETLRSLELPPDGGRAVLQPEGETTA